MLVQSSIKFIMPKIFLCLSGKEYLDAIRRIMYTAIEMAVWVLTTGHIESVGYWGE